MRPAPWFSEQKSQTWNNCSALQYASWLIGSLKKHTPTDKVSRQERSMVSGIRSKHHRNRSEEHPILRLQAWMQQEQVNLALNFTQNTTHWSTCSLFNHHKAHASNQRILKQVEISRCLLYYMLSRVTACCSVKTVLGILHGTITSWNNLTNIVRAHAPRGSAFSRPLQQPQ